MRTLVLKTSDYSLDGFVAVEDTEFFEFCRDRYGDGETIAHGGISFARSQRQGRLRRRNGRPGSRDKRDDRPLRSRDLIALTSFDIRHT